MKGNVINRISEFFVNYFSLNGQLVSQAEAEAAIREGVSFRGTSILILILAIFIASLGLNTNSTAVIIGAMLISPLMGPIIGIGLGVGIHDFELLKRCIRNLLMAASFSVIASTLYFLISPVNEQHSELLARTSPTIYDVFVALFGGAAGILSIAAKNKGQVMPGVAIATSLMPPLCTAGYGLATMQMHFFLGAFYLFFTNMIFIFVASWIGVKLMRFKKVVYQDEARSKRIKIIFYTLITAMMILSAYLTLVMVRKNVFMEKAQAFVEKEMVFPNTQVLSHKEYMNGNKRVIDVTLIGAALPKDSLQLAMVNKLDSCGLGGTILNIKQGFAMQDMKDSRTDAQFYKLMQSELTSQQTTIDSLRGVIRESSQFSDESIRIAPEVKVLFRSVRDIALARMVATSTHDTHQDTVNMIFVNAPKGLTEQERTKLKEYVGVRLSKKDLHLTMNPSGFPWPQAAKTVTGARTPE